VPINEVNNKYDECRLYTTTTTISNKKEYYPCTEWVFSKKYYSETVVTKVSSIIIINKVSYSHF
jgi:hypothetical protein